MLGVDKEQKHVLLFFLQGLRSVGHYRGVSSGNGLCRKGGHGVLLRYSCARQPRHRDFLFFSRLLFGLTSTLYLSVHYRLNWTAAWPWVYRRLGVLFSLGECFGQGWSNRTRFRLTGTPEPFSPGPFDMAVSLVPPPRASCCFLLQVFKSPKPSLAVTAQARSIGNEGCPVPQLRHYPIRQEHPSSLAATVRSIWSATPGWIVRRVGQPPRGEDASTRPPR